MQQSTRSGNESTLAHRGSTQSNIPYSSINTTASVEASRERTMHALESNQRAPNSERPAEALVSRVAEDPNAAQQLSSSGADAQKRRSGAGNS